MVPTRKFRVRLAAVVACVFASAGAAADCDHANLADQETTIASLRHLYREESFAQLDETMACLVREPRPLASGHSGSAIVYQFYRRQMTAPGVTPADIARVERWARHGAQPSMFAELAALRLRYIFAWKARGGSAASNVQEENWSRFHKGLLDLEEALYRASPELRDTPMWHHLLLAVAGDTRTRRGDIDAVFAKSVKRWPDYYGFHEVRLARMVPRWGGSWQQVNAFIEEHAGRREGAERDAVYARLYTAVMPFAGHPAETGLDWPRLQRGLETLVSRYPDPAHDVLAASYACAYQDAEYLRQSLLRMPAEDRRLASWVPPAAQARCLAPEALQKPGAPA